MKNNEDLQNQQKRSSNFRTAMSQIVNGTTPTQATPAAPAMPAAPAQATPAAPGTPTPTAPPQAAPAPQAAAPTPQAPTPQAPASQQPKAAAPENKLAGLTEQLKRQQSTPAASTPPSAPASSASSPSSSFGSRRPSGGGMDSRGLPRTILAEDFRVDGDITATGDIEINGIVNGDVTTEGHIQLLGTINGSVTAASANFQSGKLTGDSIDVQNDVVIGRDFELSAQITAQNVEIDGNVQGNLTVAASTTLHSHAKVRGDITSADLSIEKGASLSGTIKVNE